MAGRPLRYLGETRFALGSLDIEGLHGWVETGEIVFLPPRVAAYLLRERSEQGEPMWQHVRRADITAEGE